MATIIVDAKSQLRPLALNTHMEINIEEIDWCVDTALTRDVEIYVIIHGQTSGLIDIVRLVPMHPYDKTHTVYRVGAGQNIRVNNEKITAQMLILKKFTQGMTVSNYISFIIKTENYSLTRQVAIVQDLSLSMAAYYQAVAGMYNELKKGEVIDDHETCD